MTMWRRLAMLVLLAVSTGVLFADVAHAHTDTDVVAVPAGSTATVTFRPQHGCEGSPTITVAVRAPVPGAVAEEVEGWSASSTPEGDEFTVLEWGGGVLPADEAGAFPVEFVVPDAVGELLVFPAVQGCENGGELPWISGDPAAEFPAPRVLILAAGSEPAETIDDVPADAPGRDQLTSIVDVDNPSGTTTVAPPETAPVETAPVETEPQATDPASTAPESVPASTDGSVDTETSDTVTSDEATGATAPTSDADADSDDGGSATPWIIGGLVLLAAVSVAAIVAARRRSGPDTPASGETIAPES